MYILFRLFVSLALLFNSFMIYKYNRVINASVVHLQLVHIVQRKYTA